MELKITNRDHFQGSASAPVELVEYADFQCPYCSKAYYIIKQIREDLKDDLRFVFRNFPIPQLHVNAVHAALAAEAAGKQGKFWEMHDLLFENQEYLNDYNLWEYAEEINLDVSRFEADFTSKECFQKVQNDYDGGLEMGVQSTPAFFINGERYEGDWTTYEFISHLKSYV